VEYKGYSEIDISATAAARTSSAVDSPPPPYDDFGLSAYASAPPYDTSGDGNGKSGSMHKMGDDGFAVTSVDLLEFSFIPPPATPTNPASNETHNSGVL
jgi:hypothetical protein